MAKKSDFVSQTSFSQYEDERPLHVGKIQQTQTGHLFSMRRRHKAASVLSDPNHTEHRNRETRPTQSDRFRVKAA